MNSIQGPDNQDGLNEQDPELKIMQLISGQQFGGGSSIQGPTLTAPERNAVVDLFLARTSGQLDQLDDSSLKTLREMALQYIDPAYFNALVELRQRLRVSDQLGEAEALTPDELEEVINNGPGGVDIELLSKLLLGSESNYKLIRTKVLLEVLGEIWTPRSELWTDLIEYAMAKVARAMGEKRATLEEIIEKLRDGLNE